MSSRRFGASRKVREAIEAITVKLVESGMADDQNLPFETAASDRIQVVEYMNARPMAFMLKDQPYREMYYELVERRSYNVRMLDGALIQMIYEFQAGDLRRSRLAFLPSPDLLEFQSNPDVYLEDILYADVIDQKVVTVPLRVDYDGRNGVPQPVTHPASHLTLGQYAHCRIATTAPLAPYAFAELILRAFYNTASTSVSLDLVDNGHRFADTIHPNERARVHIGVPS